MITSQIWKLLWCFPFVLAALFQTGTIRHRYISSCGYLPPLEQPRGLACLWSPKCWPTGGCYALICLLRERKMGGLCDTSKKSDFCVFYIALWLSRELKKAARISLSHEPSQSQVFRDCSWAKNIRPLPLLLLWILLACPEDLIAQPLGLVDVA